MSPERMALIEAFKNQSEGLQKKFEARTYKSDWVMPYRLFKPEATGKLPLVLYLHGSGGLGDDNQKQLGLGNIFGTRVWLLPENQKKFPCYVLVPQTDRGWARYDFSQQTDVYAVDELRNLLSDGPQQMDLIAIDIQRERDLGLATLNDTRAALGLAPHTSFAEITSQPTVAANLHSTSAPNCTATSPAHRNTRARRMTR